MYTKAWSSKKMFSRCNEGKNIFGYNNDTIFILIQVDSHMLHMI